jgi:hypothetical protein
MISTEEILKRGFVDVKVYVSGLRQSHRLTIEREQMAQGLVPFLVCKHYVPTPELLRLSEELQLPVKCRDMRVFPKGKMAGDFAEKVSPIIATAVSDPVEAEIEE